MTQRLKAALGSARIQPLILLSALLFSITVGWAVSRLTDDGNTVESYEDLVSRYLEYRDHSYKLCVPSWYMYGDQIEAIESLYGLAGFQDQPDWFVRFDMGELYIKPHSALSRQIAHETRLVIYEDMGKGELLVLRDDRSSLAEEIVYTAPLWSAVKTEEALSDYLFRELSKRRVVWCVTLKDKATADAEIDAQIASANLLLPETFGGSEMLLLMGGGTCTQIVFTGMESSSNAVNVGLCIPDGVTNVDIFTCIDLLPHTWTFAARELSIQSTNFLIWTDTNQWPQGEANFRLYSAGDADVDTDEDGYADAREQMVYLTDPLNSNSRPVVVSGTVAYSGSETGTIHVLVTTNESSWSLAKSVNIPGPGSYTNDEVGNDASYWFKAFLDVDENGSRQVWEPWGLYSESSMLVTGDVSGIDITLQDQPSIWGTISYSGSHTGDVHVIAVAQSNSWDTTDETVLTWEQGTADLTGGVVYLSFPAEYSIAGMPMSNYWIRAFMDQDGDGEFSGSENAGLYSASSITVSHRLTGVDITLFDRSSDDSDLDWFTDWYEVTHMTDPMNASNYPTYLAFVDESSVITTNTTVSLDLDAFAADTVEISESVNFQPAWTATFSEVVSYPLSSDDNGWRTLYLQLVRTGETSRVFMDSLLLDTLPPSLTVTSPSPAMVTSARWISVQGTIQDDGLGVSVQIDGRYPDRTYQGGYSFERYRLDPGTNLLTVAATDRAGHSTQVVLQVVQDLSLDTTAPSISFEVPSYVGSNEVYSFSGSTDDPFAEVSMTVRQGDNEIGPIAMAGVNTQRWKSTSLFSGINEVLFVAEDPAGHATTSSYTVVRDDGFFLAITSPAPGQVINSTSVLVRGHASLDFVGATITVNGVEANLTTLTDRVEFVTVSAVPLEKGHTDLRGTASLGTSGYGLFSQSGENDYLFHHSIYDYQVTYVRTYRHSEGGSWYQWDFAPTRTIYERNWSQGTDEEIWDAGVLTDRSTSSTNIKYYYDTMFGEPEWTTSIVVGVETVSGQTSVPLLAEFGESASQNRTHISYDKYEYSLSTDISEVRFVKHSNNSEPQAVFLILPGIYKGGELPDDATNIYFRGHQGFILNNYLTFVYTVEPGVEYSITEDDFAWPVTHSYEANSPYIGGEKTGRHHLHILLPSLLNNDEPLVDLDSDIDNDGDIDDDDDPLEDKDMGEIVRVDDTDDGSSWEDDDFQYVAVEIQPNPSVGVAWFTYDTSKVKLWEYPNYDEIPSGSASSPYWDFGNGDRLPYEVYVQGLATTAPNAEIEVILHYKMDDAEWADTNRITVCGELGHHAYFASIVDYIKEYRGFFAEDYKLFEDDVDAPGGPAGFTHNLVAVLTEETTMHNHDARLDPVNKYYGDVQADFGSAVVIVNGGYFDTTWSDPEDEPPYAGRVKGICLENSSQVLHSRPVLPIPPDTEDYWYDHRGWIGQSTASDAWLYGEPASDAPLDGSLRAAVGSVIAFYPNTTRPFPSGAAGYNEEMSNIIGWSTNGVLFFIVSTQGEGTYSPSIDYSGLVDAIADSGAKTVYEMDGSSSIAFLHRDRLGNNLDVYGSVGKRHQYLYYTFAPEQRVSNYVIINWKP